jgi:hypothetical protein
MDSMLTASALIDLGIHQRRPATLPFLRIMNVSLSFRTRAASSLVVVIQARPTIGKRTSTTGPAADLIMDAADRAVTEEGASWGRSVPPSNGPSHFVLP